MTSLVNDGRPRVMAHRGASYDRPENTAAAFAEARIQGADWVELDVRLSADGVLMVNHDAHYADGRPVRQVMACDAPADTLNLAEALEACEGMGVNVEVKNLPGELDHDASDLVCEAVAGLVGAYRPIDELLVSSFDISAADRIRAAEPSLPTGWVVVARLGADMTLDRTVAHGHPVDESIVVSARERGLKVVVWTVDEPDRITQLADWAVDGIITNRPGLARSVLDGHLDG